MPIKIKCSACSHKLAVPDSYAGKRGKCPKCGEQIKIPAKAESKEKVEIQIGEPENQQESVSGIPDFGAQDAAPSLSAPSISVEALAAPSTSVPDISTPAVAEPENPFSVNPKKKGKKAKKSKASAGSTATVSRNLKQLDLISVATTLGVIYAILGLIVGIVFAAITVLMVVVIGDSNAMAGGLLSALGAVIGGPVVYGIAGFIAGLLLAALYNLAARFTGGIKMKFDS